MALFHLINEHTDTNQDFNGDLKSGVKVLRGQTIYLDTSKDIGRIMRDTDASEDVQKSDKQLIKK